MIANAQRSDVEQVFFIFVEELCVSWLYSQALVGAYWEENFSDGKPSAPLNMNPMPQLFLPSVKMTDFSRLSRFGMTFGHLTDDLGADVLTWFLAGFPARTSAQPEKELESPEIEAGSGWKWRESSMKYDHAMRSWKTRQCSLFEDSEWFSGTWPRWGLMQDGECWELPMSERPTFARGYGLLPTIRSTDGERGKRGDLIQAVRGNANSHYRLWQTPVADDCVERTKGKMNSRGEPKLSSQVKLWPTPTVCGNNNRKGASPTSGDGLATTVKMWPTPQARDHFPAHKPEYIAAKKAQGHGMSNLNDAVSMQRWPTPTKSDGMGGPGTSGRSGGLNLRTAVATPTAMDWKSGKASKATMDRNSRPLSEQIGGSLNPTWTEKLMGWPSNWTSLQETPDELSAEPWGPDWEDGIPRVATGVPARVERLKAIGNGQVPACAAEAWRVLSIDLEQA